MSRHPLSHSTQQSLHIEASFPCPCVARLLFLCMALINWIFLLLEIISACSNHYPEYLSRDLFAALNLIVIC